MEIRGRRRFLPFLLLLTALAGVQFARPSNCIGQEATLAPGDRIRVKPLIRPKDRVTGSMISVSGDTLTFEAGGDTRRLALSDIETLQRSTGEKSHVAGTIAGGFMGALAGAAIGATLERAVTDNCYDYCGWGGGFLGFIVGGIGGSFAGYQWLAHEEWADIPIRSLRVAIDPGVLRFEIGL